MAFPTGWARKCKITIPDAKIVGSNTDFPILLTEDNFPTEMLDGGVNSALNGGGDVRFSEDSAGAIRMDLDIVTFVTGGTPDVELWTKRPTLNTGAAKDIWVWYSKAGETQPAVTAAYGRNTVYSIEKTRWHLKDGAATEVNLTGNSSYDVVKAGTITEDFVNVAIGKSSADFGGVGHYDLATDPFAGLTAFTLRGWIRNTGTSADGIIGNWQGNANMSALIFTGSSDHLYVRLRNTSGTVATLISSTLVQTQPGTPWYFIAIRYDGSNFYIDIDGVNEKAGAFSGTINTAATNNPEIGRFNSDANTRWAGNLKELALSPSDLGFDWTKTEYNNQSDPATFAIPGTPEAVGSGAILTVQSAVNNHTADSPTLSQAHSLSPNSTSHSQTADIPPLSQGKVITVNDAAHGLSSDQAALNQVHSLTPNNAAHSQAADSPTLTAGQSLGVSDGPHDLTSNDVTLNQLQALVAHNSTHGLMSDMAGTFNPSAFSPNPIRSHKATREKRTSSPSSADRTTHPSNPRTLRI